MVNFQSLRSLVLMALLILGITSDLAAQAEYDLSALAYRSVGPLRGGRVTTVAGTRDQPGTFYLGATGGGVWKTTDYGTSWHNVSDGFFATPSIGAITVAENEPNVIYVGTGSDGLRSNVIVGKGMYRSTDGGDQWEHVGLEKVGQIGAVVVHPNNPKVVYVAAIGQPFKNNEERGIYRTYDGGENWEKILYLSDEVGFSDVEMLPGQPDVLFATAWKAQRKPWTIISGGTQAEGGIYKSTDGGDNWERVTEGLPGGLIGKIDVATCPSRPNRLYALVEAPDRQGGLYRSDDTGYSWIQVSANRRLRTRPFYYTNVRVDPTNEDVVYVLATAYSKSTDGGRNWVRMNPPHGDSHDMWINPDNPQLFVQANDGGANVTHNGGETWSTQFNQPTAELYQVEVDNQYPYWLYAGQQDNYTTIAVPSFPPDGRQAPNVGWIINTGGCETGPAVPHPTNPDIVYANCKGRFGVYNKNTGQERSYYVGAANMYGHNPADLKYRFQRVSPIHISPHDPSVVYHASQYVHRTTNEGETWETISPDLTAFEADKQVISGSPITRDITGEEFYSTIYSLRESPVQAGIIWTGANDGPVHVTIDNGATWTNVTPPDLPPGGRVDAVEPSPHRAEECYIAVLRYQLGDEQPYIYRTTDLGKNWTLLSGTANSFPQDQPVRVVRQDPKAANILYAGTEYGMFVSFNTGQHWQSLQMNLPVTPVTDIKVHRNDLVLSTMGRGFWILDNVALLHHLQAEALTDTPALFPEAMPTIRRRQMRVRGQDGIDYGKPTMDIDYYLPGGEPKDLRLTIYNSQGEIVNEFESASPGNDEEVPANMAMNRERQFMKGYQLDNTPGLHRFGWDMYSQGSRRERLLVPPGEYVVRLSYGDFEQKHSFQLTLDERVLASGVTADDIAEQYAFLQKVSALYSRATQLRDDAQDRYDAMTVEQRRSKEGQRLSDVLNQLNNSDDAIYPQPGLVGQINYLASMVRGADQRVGDEAQARLRELEEIIDGLE